MDQGDATQVKVITVSPGGFQVIPANSSVPIVVMCSGYGPTEVTTGVTTGVVTQPDPGEIFDPTTPHPGTAEVVTIEALSSMNPASDLGADVSTLIVEAAPTQYPQLSILNNLAQDQTLAERGVNIEVRGLGND